LICVVISQLVVFASCKGRPKENVTETDRGAFKVLVRSQEFHNSGSLNIDICMANISSPDFPSNGAQCFLKGYDFSGLAVKWTSEREVEISFAGGRVSHFTNYAFVYPNGPIPVEFHAILRDGHDTGSNGVPGR
jgi:hypothetical protein